jgi:protein SCO1
MKHLSAWRHCAAGLPALAAALLAGCIQPKPLPIMGQAPSFQLTAETGGPFDSQSLAGRIWVADFVYTNCTGPCPMMSSQMRQIQDRTAEIPDLALVSFTVDPARDTPPVLAAYAKRFRANPKRWVFLTGEPARLNDVALTGFKLNSVDGSLSHSSRFALVDRQGRIRGYYISTDDDFMTRLLHDIRQLEREKS